MNATLSQLYRYPVKGLSPEPLPRAELRPHDVIAGDRRFAIENGPSGFDQAAPRHFPKSRFLMLMRNERLATLDTRFDDETNRLRILCDGALAVDADLSTAEGRGEVAAFFKRFMPAELRGEPQILEAPGFSFSDVSAKVVSIINLASVQAIEAALGVPVHPLRFRANLYVTGWPAWHEFDLLGRTVAIGGTARLKVTKRIVRCAATDVDPETGMRDLTLPASLMRAFDHMDCGVYAEVREAGAIAPGDVVQPA